MNAKQEKSKSPNKRAYVKLIYTLASFVAAIVFIITFAYNRYIPTWNEIGFYLFGTVPKDLDCNYVKFIDVGQGDAVLINSKGVTALIDLGPEPDDGDELLRDLHKFGVYTLDCVIISHFDSDHIGGDQVIGRMKIKNIIMPQTESETNESASHSFDEFDFAARQSGANILLAQVGTEITIGDFKITIVAYYPDSKESNDKSVMVMAEIDDRRFLLTGDATSEIENRLLNDGYMLDCDVFKAGHHGSRYSNSLKFLEAITPSYTVISCSAANTYGHPHAEVLSNLNKVKSHVYRTDIKGDVTFYINDGNIEVKTQK